MVTSRHVTIEEFARTPREGSWELIDGEPVEMTPTGGESGSVSGNLLLEVANHVRREKLGWVFAADTGFVLFPHRDTVRAPDVAFVRADRLAKLPKGFVPLAPDLAVEVLSPTDRMTEALSKVTMYLEAGVRLVWLVDPATRTIADFRPDAAPRTVRGGELLDGGEVLPGFELPVSEIFG